jgi:hypothetical protein
MQVCITQAQIKEDTILDVAKNHSASACKGTKFASELPRIVADCDGIVAELLRAYPSDEHHEIEILLLPGRLNNKKASLFSIDGHNVISTDKV